MTPMFVVDAALVNKKFANCRPRARNTAGPKLQNHFRNARYTTQKTLGGPKLPVDSPLDIERVLPTGTVPGGNEAVGTVTLAIGTDAVATGTVAVAIGTVTVAIGTRVCTRTGACIT